MTCSCACETHPEGGCSCGCDCGDVESLREHLAAKTEEVERLDEQNEAYAIQFTGLVQDVDRLTKDLDEARSSLARLEAERDEAKAEARSARNDYWKGVERFHAAEAECSRLREEGARAFNEGVEAAATLADLEARATKADCGDSLTSRMVQGCALVIAKAIRALKRPSPATSTAPADTSLRACGRCGYSVVACCCTERSPTEPADPSPESGTACGAHEEGWADFACTLPKGHDGEHEWKGKVRLRSLDLSAPVPGATTVGDAPLGGIVLGIAAEPAPLPCGCRGLCDGSCGSGRRPSPNPKEK